MSHLVHRFMASRVVVFVAAATLALPVAGAAAGSPETKCESSKNVSAGKYAQCMFKARKKVLTGDADGYDSAALRCAGVLEEKFAVYENVAAGACPTNGDSSAIRDYLDACVLTAQDGLAGGSLPDEEACLSALDACELDVGTCDAIVAGCEMDRTACDATLGSCTTEHATCADGLATCLSGLDQCVSDVTSCDASVSNCSATLGACESGLGTCTSDLSACSTDLGTCNDSLGTCNDADAACDVALTTCEAELSDTDADLAACLADVALAALGTAVASDALDGATFRSAAGASVVGTIPNRGAVTLTPTTTDQVIAAGYHDGNGRCAGDADLAADNIKSGVNVFGVVGTLPATRGSLKRTNQSLCWDAAGAATACAGSGQDGESQRGVANVFTDNGNGTITDNVTGLIWEKLDDNNLGGIHDKDNTYTLANAYSRITTLNSSGGFAGYTDWRLPNIRELESLVDYGASAPTTFSTFHTSCMSGCVAAGCSCTTSGSYWSSTTHPQFSHSAPGIDFATGVFSFAQKTSTARVRAVRGGV